MPESDPSPHFAALLAVLETVVATKGYTDPAVMAEAAAGARSARAAGVPPERVIAYLRTRLHGAPLSAVGDWYRAVLVERLVGQAIQAYFDVPNEPAPIE